VPHIFAEERKAKPVGREMKFGRGKTGPNTSKVQLAAAILNLDETWNPPLSRSHPTANRLCMHHCSAIGELRLALSQRN
jgi:hypothetical protein